MVFASINYYHSFFVQACEEIGVPRQKRFVLHDLVTKKGDSVTYASSKRVSTYNI